MPEVLMNTPAGAPHKPTLLDRAAASLSACLIREYYADGTVRTGLSFEVIGALAAGVVGGLILCGPGQLVVHDLQVRFHHHHVAANIIKEACQRYPAHNCSVHVDPRVSTQSLIAFEAAQAKWAQVHPDQAAAHEADFWDYSMTFDDRVRAVEYVAAHDPADILR